MYTIDLHPYKQRKYITTKTLYYITALTRACLDQQLITIRSPGICNDHMRSDTSLITITSLSHLLHKLH